MTKVLIEEPVLWAVPAVDVLIFYRSVLKLKAQGYESAGDPIDEIIKRCEQVIKERGIK